SKRLSIVRCTRVFQRRFVGRRNSSGKGKSPYFKVERVVLEALRNQCGFATRFSSGLTSHPISLRPSKRMGIVFGEADAPLCQTLPSLSPIQPLHVIPYAFLQWKPGLVAERAARVRKI